MNDTYKQYKCPKCGQGGAHPPHLPAPKCHRCECRVTMGPVLSTERAASPAESVQSIDAPEFGLLIAKLELAATQIDHSRPTAPRYGAAFKALVDHIDASRAAAHAEGRRSAMEELAKEKERADRADNALKEWLDKTQWVQDAVQSNKFSVMYLGHHRADVIRQEFDRLAVRQAPDLSKLQRSFPSIGPGSNLAQMFAYEEGDYVRFDDVQALLSSTAQPLQQEGGK